MSLTTRRIRGNGGTSTWLTEIAGVTKHSPYKKEAELVASAIRKHALASSKLSFRQAIEAIPPHHVTQTSGTSAPQYHAVPVEQESARRNKGRPQKKQKQTNHSQCPAQQTEAAMVSHEQMATSSGGASNECGVAELDQLQSIQDLYSDEWVTAEIDHVQNGESVIAELDQLQNGQLESWGCVCVMLTALAAVPSEMQTFKVTQLLECLSLLGIHSRGWIAPSATMLRPKQTTSTLNLHQECQETFLDPTLTQVIQYTEARALFDPYPFRLPPLLNTWKVCNGRGVLQ